MAHVLIVAAQIAGAMLVMVVVVTIAYEIVWRCLHDSGRAGYLVVGIGVICGVLMLLLSGCQPPLQGPPIDPVEISRPDPAAPPVATLTAPPPPTVPDGQFRAWVPREVQASGTAVEGHWVLIPVTAPPVPTLSPAHPIPRAPQLPTPPPRRAPSTAQPTPAQAATAAGPMAAPHFQALPSVAPALPPELLQQLQQLQQQQTPTSPYGGR